MGKKDWRINEIDPSQDLFLSEAADLTRIHLVTLQYWRRNGRLKTYGNQQLTCGQWLIDAIRGSDPLTDAEIKARHRLKHPGRARARQDVTKAIKRGDLVPGPCDICGITNTIEAHHTDYSQPLKVRWLCKEHHRWEHRRLNSYLHSKGRSRLPKTEVSN